MSDRRVPIRIKDISPDLLFRSEEILRGVISLRWPYSSSQSALSIQLADEDVRRRGDKGHVRMTFHGAAAAALKDLPSLSLLEISAAPDSVSLEHVEGSARDINYRLNFNGDVTVQIGDGVATTLDSRKIQTASTPTRSKRTWASPDLVRSNPPETLGLDESWFSGTTPDLKRVRYSSSFRFIDSTQATPAKSPRTSFPEAENDVIRQFRVGASLMSKSASSPSDKRNGADFQFPIPSAPARSENGLQNTTDVPATSHGLSQSEPVTFIQETSSPRKADTLGHSIISLDIEHEGRVQGDNSRPNSTHGDSAISHPGQTTPRSGPQVHFNFASVGSAPPTPRNVPDLSMESASEQEDLYRKLRASAPPKSDAGSSMVADEDDETGNLAEDPKPTILETQSRVQEGILRKKIHDEAEEDDVLKQSTTVHIARAALRQNFASNIETEDNDNAEDNVEGRPDVANLTVARSTIAAYGNSLDGNESLSAARLEEAVVDRQRETSPSMTERGAAVQESVFRSKIHLSDSGSNLDEHSIRSVKSSILVEPAAASVDGSIHENVERTMLDQQALVQETLFREKLNRTELLPGNIVQNLSVVGQSYAASSNTGETVVNEEPSMLQQQANVQEFIFRDKVGQQDHEETHPTASVSLDHMEVTETNGMVNSIDTDSQRNQIHSADDRDPGLEDTTQGALSTYTAGSIRTIEQFHEKADVEHAVKAPIGDTTDQAEAQEFLRMEMLAEPEEHFPVYVDDNPISKNTLYRQGENIVSMQVVGVDEAQDFHKSAAQSENARLSSADAGTFNRSENTHEHSEEESVDEEGLETGQLDDLFDAHDARQMHTQKIPEFPYEKNRVSDEAGDSIGEDMHDDDSYDLMDEESVKDEHGTSDLEAQEMAGSIVKPDIQLFGPTSGIPRPEDGADEVVVATLDDDVRLDEDELHLGRNSDLEIEPDALSTLKAVEEISRSGRSSEEASVNNMTESELAYEEDRPVAEGGREGNDDNDNDEGEDENDESNEDNEHNKLERIQSGEAGYTGHITSADDPIEITSSDGSDFEDPEDEDQKRMIEEVRQRKATESKGENGNDSQKIEAEEVVAVTASTSDVPLDTLNNAEPSSSVFAGAFSAESKESTPRDQLLTEVMPTI